MKKFNFVVLLLLVISVFSIGYSQDEVTPTDTPTVESTPSPENTLIAPTETPITVVVETPVDGNLSGFFAIFLTAATILFGMVGYGGFRVWTFFTKFSRNLGTVQTLERLAGSNLSNDRKNAVYEFLTKLEELILWLKRIFDDKPTVSQSELGNEEPQG